MRKLTSGVASLVLALAAPALAAPAGGAPAPSRPLVAAVADPGRPAAAQALDESRKPAEVLAFLGLRQGMTAADLITGTGYWAEIMARAVGARGSVEAFEPEQFYTDPAGKFALDGVTARNGNLVLTRYPFESFATPVRRFDFAIINASYHDLYWQSEQFRIPRADPAAFLKAVFAMMKPGGVVGVIDHAGPAGDTRAIVEKLHRIDPATVKKDFEAAGFRLIATSDLLRNAADDLQKPIFDPAVRGRTDRFLFKFVKPR